MTPEEPPESIATLGTVVVARVSARTVAVTVTVVVTVLVIAQGDGVGVAVSAEPGKLALTIRLLSGCTGR